MTQNVRKLDALERRAKKKMKNKYNNGYYPHLQNSIGP